MLRNFSPFVSCLSLLVSGSLAAQTVINDTQTQSTDLDLGNIGELLIGSGAGESGLLTVVPDATVTTKLLQLGAGAADASGTLIVVGAGAAVVYATDTVPGDAIFHVGLEGAGALHVLNGGTVDSGRLWMASGAAAGGTLLVSGAGSSLHAAIDILMGEYGTTTVTVTDGGQVTMGQFLHVGSVGDSNGVLNISGGGLVRTGTTVATNGGISVGRGDNAYGEINVSGAGSALESSSWIILGRDGEGEGVLNVTNGGRMETGETGSADTRYLRLGASVDTKGSVTVSGEGSLIRVWDYIHLGQNGTGEILIEDQGEISVRTAVHLGRNAGGAGTLTVTSGGVLESGSFVYAGNVGNGTIKVLDGGTVISGGNFFIARESTSTGELTVTGEGSRVEAKAAFLVGASPTGVATGNGTATVAAGGVIDVVGNVLIRGQGSMDVQAGGTLRTGGNITLGSGASLGTLSLSGGRIAFDGSFAPDPVGFNWTAGTLEVSGTLDGLGAMPAGGRIELLNGSVTGSGLSMGAGAVIEGFGSMASPVDLGSDGTIRADGGALSLAGAVTGSGTLAGPVVHGVLAPGNSVGAITLEGVTFGADAGIHLQISGPTAFDEIFFDEFTSFAGASLTISFLEYTPAASETFALFTHLGAGAAAYDFASITTPDGWFLSDGVLAIPEPSTVSALAALAVLALAMLRRRR